MHWLKSDTLAGKFLQGDKTLESLVRIIDLAINYGIAKERTAIIKRLQKGRSLGAFRGSERLSGRVLEAASQLARGIMSERK